MTLFTRTAADTLATTDVRTAVHPTDPAITPIPAAWVTVTTVRHCNLFVSTDALTFTLSAANASSYEVRNFYGTLVASGGVSGTTLTVPALALGWYRLYLRRSGVIDTNFGTLIGASMFSVLRPDTRFPTPPINGSLSGAPPGNSFVPAQGNVVSSNVRFEAPDHCVRGVAMLGPTRIPITDAAAPTGGLWYQNPGNIANGFADQEYVNLWYTNFQPDPVRPRPGFLQFPNGGVSTQAQRDGVTATVVATYPSIKYFEGWANEPIGGFDANPTTGYVANMTAFYNAVKAGNPNAKVMGPNPVSIVGCPDGTIGASLDKLFAAIPDKFDAISFHGYNMCNGDIVHGRRVLDAFMTILTKYGMQNKELWQTEWGCYAINGGQLPAVLQPGIQTQWVMLQRFLLEQYGVPKERDHYFYDTQHGFYGFTGWWKNTDQTLLPMIAVMRVYSQEIWGKVWAVALDFGPVENNHIIGNRFDAPDGSKTLALLAAGRYGAAVTLRVDGASSVEMVEAFGTVTTTSVTAGKLVLTLGELPTYVRVPIGVTITVVPRIYGKNIVTWGAHIPSNVDNAEPLLRLINSIHENRYFQGPPALARSEYRDDSTLPVTVTTELTNARRFDTILVECPYPWSDQCAFLDFDVAYRTIGGVWNVVATFVESPLTVPCLVPAAQGGTATDLFYSCRHVFLAEFDAVIGNAVRVTVRATTVSYPENASRVGIREIEVYCRAAANGA